MIEASQPASAAAVRFINYNNGNGGDYHLQASSPYKGKVTDGKDLGADINAIHAATAGVETPECVPDMRVLG
jgi:hypothetical protein